MFEQSDVEKTIENNEKKIKELAIKVETLDREAAELLEELNVTPEQLTAFIENKKNFTDQNWEELQDHRKTLDQKLKTELENIRNPRKTEKTYSEMKIDKQWIPVK
ncbi:MAG: hypothetical protein K940chlam7_01348 [Chlamydiae bacterium]|nr:hypothetical protein [Chlamydiota bacterium]